MFSSQPRTVSQLQEDQVLGGVAVVSQSRSPHSEKVCGDAKLLMVVVECGGQVSS